MKKCGNIGLFYGNGEKEPHKVFDCSNFCEGTDTSTGTSPIPEINEGYEYYKLIIGLQEINNLKSPEKSIPDVDLIRFPSSSSCFSIFTLRNDNVLIRYTNPAEHCDIKTPILSIYFIDSGSSIICRYII
jgi:hypothetical protein